jgi:hypothetical protein
LTDDIKDHQSVREISSTISDFISLLHDWVDNSDEDSLGDEIIEKTRYTTSNGTICEDYNEAVEFELKYQTRNDVVSLHEASVSVPNGPCRNVSLSFLAEIDREDLYSIISDAENCAAFSNALLELAAKFEQAHERYLGEESVISEEEDLTQE